MPEGPSQASRAPAPWVQKLLRPLAADEVAARFWVRHLRVGTALSELSALSALIYVIVADRPHQATFIVIAVVVMAGSPCLLLLPIQQWSTSSRGPLIFYLWSFVLMVVVMTIALLDGGSESPLLWLLVLAMAYAALAYPPLGVCLVGATMVGAYLAVAFVDASLGAGTFLVVAVLAMFTLMTAWVSSNHWKTYQQQVLLAAQHEELNRAREEFIATTSHEVRTPVASILGYLELLEDADLPPEQVAKFVTVIRRNAARLKELSEDLLVLSHWEAEQRRRQEGEETGGDVDLVRLAHQVCETLAPMADRQGVALDVETPGRPLVVTGSAEQLERAVLNLISNAVKYTPAGGTVTCTVRRDADEALVLVSDTGIGIADEELEGLFGRFFRASSARAQSIAGVGLGLSIVREIVSAHGGRVEVSSQLGQGTTFVVHLPGPRPDGTVGDLPRDLLDQAERTDLPDQSMTRPA